MELPRGALLCWVLTGIVAAGCSGPTTEAMDASLAEDAGADAADATRTDASSDAADIAMDAPHDAGSDAAADLADAAPLPDAAPHDAGTDVVSPTDAHVVVDASVDASTVLVDAAMDASLGIPDAGVDAAMADTGTDAGADAAVADAAVADAGVASDLVGSISIVQINMRVGPSMVLVNETAAFHDLTTPGASCARRAVGPCQIGHCTWPVTEPDRRSAGTVTVSGGTGTPIVMMPTSVGMTRNRYAATQNVVRWLSGDAVSVVATGSTVPAFSASLVFPQPLTVSSPTAPMFGTTFPLDRAAGLTATWLPRAPGAASVRIIAVQGTTAGSTRTENLVACTFADAAGTGTLPPAALTDFTLGAGSDSFLIVGRSSTTTVMAGPWTVDVAADDTGFFALIDVR